MFSQRPAHRPAEPNDPRGGRTSLLKLPFERVRRTFQSKSPASDIPVMSASNPFLKNPSLSTSISSDSIEKPKSPWQHSQIPRAIGVTGVRRQSSIKPHGPRENPPSSSATLVGSSSRSTGLWSNSVLGINDENTTSSTTLATVEIPTEWDRVAKLLHTQLTVKELESLSPPVRSRSKGSRPVSVVAPTLTRNRSGTSSIPKPTSSSRLGDATSSSNTSKLVKPSILEVIILALQVALKDNSKRWEITTADGTKVNIRAKFRAFISGLQKVVEFGGSHHMAGAQKGPESVVAVVWNVAKFVLEVDVTNIELLGIVESTFETIYVAMGDCAIHESVISAASAASGNRQGHTPDRRLSSPIEASMAPTDVLQVGLVELYAAILVFAVKAKEYVATAGRSERSLRFFFSEFGSLIGNVQEKRVELLGIIEKDFMGVELPGIGNAYQVLKLWTKDQTLGLNSIRRSMEEGSERAAEERKAAIPTSRTDFESGGPSPGFREAAVVVEVGEETINTVNTLPTSPAAAGAGAVTSSDDQIIDTTNRFRYSVVNPRLRPLKPKSTLKECRKWVSCANQDHRECRSSEYQLKKKQWHSGTCTWLLREPEYVNWRDRIPGISNILVVQGNNGFGKSVLATWVIGNLCGPATSDLRQPRNKPIVLDFFFRNGRSFAESTEDMARSLADQLLIHSGGPKQCVDVDERCIRVIDNLRQSGQRATFQNAWTAFQDMAKVIERPIYIVIDAIDECSPAFRTELLDAFQNLDCRGLGIHLLMTSRPEYSLTDVINQWPSLDFSNSAVKADIHLYLTSRLVHQKYITLRPYREKVVKVLSQQAGGMFQYAALMLEELRYLPSDKDVKKVLSQPPRDLHAAYSWILGHRLDPRLLWLRKVIFTWLLHKFKNTEGNSARAPVSVSEIVSIMSFPLAPEHPSHPILGSSDTLPPPHRIRVNIDQIRRACGPLIDIRDSNGRGGDCVLSFSHNSVGAFLKMTPTELKQHIKMRETDALPNAVLECLVGEREAHISMTLSCISQLTSSSTTAGDWIHPRPCFLEYSARYWLYHARIAQSMPDQDSLAPFWEAITRFILSCCTWPKDTIHKAARTRDPEGNPWNESFHHYWPWLLTKTTEPIDLAVISGLKAPVQNLSERPGVPLIPEHVHLSIATMGQPQFIQTLLTHTNIGNFNCPFQDNRLINAMQEAVKTESQLPYNAHHFMNFERVINNTTAQPTLIKRLVRNHASHLGLTPLAITGLGHPRESPAGSVERILNTSRCLMRHMPRTEKTLMEYLRILPDYLATHPINIDTITSVINHIPNFNLLDGDTGMSILGIMCLKGPLDVSIFTQILQRCPPKMIKQKDKMGATPLMHLVCDRKQEYGHGVECQRRMEVMRMLISRGATVHESMYKADRRVSSMYEELERRNSRHRTPVGADGSGGGTARGCASCMELRRLLVSAAGEGNKRSLNPSKWFCC